MERHTAQRILERLRDEHGHAGAITIVKDYVRAQRLPAYGNTLVCGFTRVWGVPE
jgi:hypothetical protein